MLREGPIPRFLHGFYEYIGGAALIAVPLLVEYKHGAATAVSVVLGVLAIAVASMTTGPTSLVNQFPLAVHILWDYALAALLIASPFLFGFSDETAPTVIFIAAGVLHLLVSIGTRFRSADAEVEVKPRRRKRTELTDDGAAGEPAAAEGARPAAGEAPSERA